MTMPPIIYGTAWKKEQTEALVLQALRAGFRGIEDRLGKWHRLQESHERSERLFVRQHAPEVGEPSV